MIFLRYRDGADEFDDDDDEESKNDEDQEPINEVHGFIFLYPSL